MNATITGGCVALMFVVAVVLVVLWRRETADVARWRSWYGSR